MLTKAGLRCTHERLVVLTYLVNIHTPHTIDDLHRMFREVVNKVTLYRMLERFADDALVERVVSRDGVRRYEYQDEHHHHITCTRCGTRARIEVPEDVLLMAVHESTKDFSLVSSHTLEYYGMCKACA